MLSAMLRIFISQTYMVIREGNEHRAVHNCILSKAYLTGQATTKC